MLSRRFFLFAAFAASLLLGTPARAEDDPAVGFVNNLATQAIEVMTSKSVPDGERTERFRKLFIGSVDLQMIGKYVLARYWRIATPDEQQEFLKLFEDMLVLTWSNRFKDAANKVTFAVDESKPDVDDGVIVESRILREKQEAVPVTWRLRKSPEGLRIIDLVIEGTSMTFTYRQEYASVINQRGGKVEGLLGEMKRKVAQLSQPQTATN